MTPTTRPIVYHIPVCPFSQRLEILLELKGLTGAVPFHVVDITEPRPDWLLAKLRGGTALPALETAQGRVLKESLVLLRYLDETFPDRPIARPSAEERAVENMMIALEGPFGAAGYRFLLNQDLEQRAAMRDAMLQQYKRLDELLRHDASGDTWLFDGFGLAEAVFTPLFMRFWCLEYYEGFELPSAAEFARVNRWRDACLAHPAAGQVTYEQIIKLYYDYALGVGNGALAPGRARSSFVFDPDWRERPMPPRDKYAHPATDAELGLLLG